jgi:hypothetical protein
MNTKELRKLAEEAWTAMDDGEATMTLDANIVHALAQGAADACDALAARASMLELLDAPSPGLRVRGEGFCYVFKKNGPFWLLEAENGADLEFPQDLPLIKALVSSGAAQVVEGED